MKTSIKTRLLLTAFAFVYACGQIQAQDIIHHKPDTTYYVNYACTDTLSVDINGDGAPDVLFFHLNLSYGNEFGCQPQNDFMLREEYSYNHDCAYWYDYEFEQQWDFQMANHNAWGTFSHTSWYLGGVTRAVEALCGIDSLNVYCCMRWKHDDDVNYVLLSLNCMHGDSYQDAWHSYYLTIKEYAYCTLPNYPLRAGQTRIDASIDEAETFSFTMYPNPADNSLAVQGSDLRMVEVYDLTGQCLLCKPAEGAETQIDLAALASGLYFVRVTGTDGKQGVRKVVKE
mgnify:FL=1